MIPAEAAGCDQRSGYEGRSFRTLFRGAGRSRDPALSTAARQRRQHAEETAGHLLQGGMLAPQVHSAALGDTMLDVATEGRLRDYFGLPRRRWSGFADQAYAARAWHGRAYEAFCAEHRFANVVQLVLGRVPPRGVGAVGKSPAGATATSLAQAGDLSTAVVTVVAAGRVGLRAQL